MQNIINIILNFQYTPYIAVFLLAFAFILLLPFISLITTINKVSRLFESRQYPSVIRKVESYFKFHKYEKTLLSFLYDSYLKLNNKQKALHYMQIAVEKGFIKDKYLKMFHNTRMAQILFDLNQTTESFQKLYEVFDEGQYEANWCHLFGLIFLSQHQIENALYYLERALFISKKSPQIFFDYTVALSFKLREKSLANAMELFIKNSKKEAIFIIFNSYMFKKDFSNAKLWLNKASFADNYLLECYRKLLILYCSFNILSKKTNERKIDESKSKILEPFTNYTKEDLNLLNAEKTELILALNNALKSDELDSSKAILLKDSLYMLKILNDEPNFNHFLVFGKSNYSLFESIDEEQTFSDQKIDDFNKRIQQSIILLDIFNYSIKKELIPPIEFVKKEFEQLKPTATQTEKLRKNILSQYLRLTDRGFVKVNLRVVRLFEYIPTKIKSTFLHDKGLASLRILATEIEYPHKNALFIFRRSDIYDISYKLFETINKDLEEQNIDSCFFFYNFTLDSDAEKYLQDFPKITFYDQAHLALFLEESMKDNVKR